MTDVLDLAKRLIAAPSVTPATGAVFDEMQSKFNVFKVLKSFSTFEFLFFKAAFLVHKYTS